MKHKKTIFNTRLWIEGLRQLKTLGIIGLVINLIIGIVIPVGSCLSAKNDYNMYLKNNIPDQFTKYALSIGESHFYYLLFFLLFAPLMVISLFKFLNQRENCDFYHSLPHKRQCIFFSFSASIFTWLFVEIFLTTSVSAVLYRAFSQYLVLDTSQLFCFALNILITSVLVASVMLLALTLSGNLITGMIVFLIIFFIPRVFITVYPVLLKNALPYLTNNIIPILNAKNNLFYEMFIDLSNSSSDCCKINFSSLYTLIIAAAAFVFAYISFRRRNSEAAGNSMNSRLLQAFFRTVFTMLICLIPVSIIFEYHVFRDTAGYGENTSMLWFYIIISYIAAVVGMFLYELLTTKNVKNALKSFRSIPVIALLNVVIIFLLFTAFHHYQNVRLEEDEIDSVNILSQDFYYSSYNQSYFEKKLSQFSFTNEQITSLLCGAYNDYADMYNEYLEGKRESPYYRDINSAEPVISLVVEFHGNSKQTFSFYMDNKTSAAFKDLFYSDEHLQDIYMKLPALTEKDTIYLNNFTGMSEPETTDVKKIYESLRNELAESDISLKTWFKNLDNYSSTEYIVLEKYMDSGYYELNLPVSPATPKTYALLLDSYLPEHGSDLEEFLDFSEDFETFSINSNGEKVLNFYITGYDYDRDIYLYTDLYSPSDTDSASEKAYQTAALSLLRNNVKPFTGTVSEGDVLIYIRAEENDYINNNYISKAYILCLPEDVFEQLSSESLEY